MNWTAGEKWTSMVGAGFECGGASVPVAMLIDMIKLIPVHET
jgi:hypothetical protein